MFSVLSCLYFTDDSKHYNRVLGKGSQYPEMENLIHLTNQEAESEWRQGKKDIYIFGVGRCLA